MENQRATRPLTDTIRAIGFYEPVNSLYFSSQFQLRFLLAPQSFVIVMDNLKEYHM